MLIDDLDRAARERLRAISARLDGLDMPMDQKTAIGTDLVAVKDMLGTLDVQGLEFVNKTLENILKMLFDPQVLISLEPIMGMLLSLLLIMGGGVHGKKQEGGPRPRVGMER